ncbi:head-tail connector protein [Pantoea sp. 18069]|uniref:head-tail connector protein n=1 Tax=Pantoea sp. 18069 TaxID=2681415 RepID=UPI001358F664|nr:head-tail connector protein [Pantoea sp. 18069]
MQKIDLARAKLHLRMAEDDVEEDLLIEGWIAAAYLAIEGKIFSKLYEGEAEIPEGRTGVVIDEVIHAAAQLILGHLYVNREEVAPGQAATIPMGAEWLLLPYVDTSKGF